MKDKITSLNVEGFKHLFRETFSSRNTSFKTNFIFEARHHYLVSIISLI